MFRRSLLFLTFIAVSVLVFVFAFKKTDETYSVDVSLNVVKATNHFRDPHKMIKWMQPFASGKPGQVIVNNQQIVLGKDSLKFLQLGFVDMRFRRSNGKDSLTYVITADAPENQPEITRFILSFPTTPWKKMTQKNPLVEESFRNMDAFATMMKDPIKVYGYNIHETTVTDTSFLFSSRTIATEKFAAESKLLFDLLIGEAKKRDAGYNGVRIFNWQDNGNGTLSIFAGIGVTKRIETPDGDVVSYKMMPYQKNLLVVDFEGTYKEVMNVYAAMEEYKEDHNRVSMAIPFHKYISEGYGFSDSQVVKLRVSLPVY